MRLIALAVILTGSRVLVPLAVKAGPIRTLARDAFGVTAARIRALNAASSIFSPS